MTRLTKEEIEARSAKNKAAWKGVKMAGSYSKTPSLDECKITGDIDVILKPSKYKNKKTEVDGILFDSKREAERWIELKALEAAGKISDLRRQVRIPLVVKETLVAHWVADFQYIDSEAPSIDSLVWEDVKSAYTRKLPLYRLKNKLVKAIYGREIRET